VAPKSEWIRFGGRSFPRPGTAAQGEWYPHTLERLRSLAAAARLAPAPARGEENAPSPTVLAWQTGGVPVTSSLGVQAQPSVAPDAGGGAIVVWSDYRNFSNTYTDIYANRLDGNGDFPTGWSANGLAVAVIDSFQISPAVVPDGAGGAFVAFTEIWTGQPFLHDVIVQRITGDGAIASGWPANGKRFSFGEITAFTLRTDDAGGCFVGWIDPTVQAYLLRLNGAGNPVANWPSPGLAVGEPGHGDLDMVADGTGGAYVTWVANDSILCTLITGSGGLASGWDPAGNEVSSGGVFAGTPTIARLSGGDAMIAWDDFRNFVDLDVFARRITPSATFPIGWSGSGMPVCTALGNQQSPVIVRDASNGAVIAWEGDNAGGSAFFAQHVTGAAGLSPGWPVDGVLLCDAASFKESPLIVSDNASGALLAWSDNRTMTDYGIYAQRILAGTGFPPGFPADGATICDLASDQDSPSMTTDAANGAIVAWEDFRNSSLRVYAARVLGDGTVSANASLVSATAESGVIRLHWFSPDGASFSATLERDVAGAGFGAIASLRASGTGDVSYEDRDVAPGVTYRYRLMVEETGGRRAFGEVTLTAPNGASFALEGVRPNPAATDFSVSFTLPDAAGARLEVLDLSGRRVLARDVGSLGAGRHLVRLDGGETLPAGVYVVRLARGGRTLTTRVAVVR
jgi:hypothetical protein